MKWRKWKGSRWWSGESGEDTGGAEEKRREDMRVDIRIGGMGVREEEGRVVLAPGRRNRGSVKRMET